MLPRALANRWRILRCRISRGDWCNSRRCEARWYSSMSGRPGAPPCIEEMPTMQRLYERLHSRGLEVLAISIDALGAQVVAPFMQQYQLTFPALLDPQDRTPHLYHIKGVPESFIVDKRGLLVDKVIGPRDWSHPQILALFERLLAASVPDAEARDHASTAPTSTDAQLGAPYHEKE